MRDFCFEEAKRDEPPVEEANFGRSNNRNSQHRKAGRGNGRKGNVFITNNTLNMGGGGRSKVPRDPTPKPGHVPREPPEAREDFVPTTNGLLLIGNGDAGADTTAPPSAVVRVPLFFKAAIPSYWWFSKIYRYISGAILSLFDSKHLLVHYAPDPHPTFMAHINSRELGRVYEYSNPFGRYHGLKWDIPSLVGYTSYKIVELPVGVLELIEQRFSNTATNHIQQSVQVELIKAGYGFDNAVAGAHLAFNKSLFNAKYRELVGIVTAVVPKI